ncbi:unnamed protein product [Absidia cylindrospora]
MKTDELSILLILLALSIGISGYPQQPSVRIEGNQHHSINPKVSLLRQQNRHTSHFSRGKLTQSSLNECVDYNTDFSVETDGWIPFDSDGDTFSQVGDGMQLDLVPPSEFVRLVEDDTNLPYNGQPAKGATFASEFYMHYGRVSATMRSSRVGGSITAFILMSDTGDEIDFEFLGGDAHQVQTNYFYAGEELFTVNGGLHEVDGAAVFDDFHTYTIDWRPERIQWIVDGKVVRVKEKSDTCKDGICKYPSSPA